MSSNLQDVNNIELEVLPLHHYAHFMEACCKLINSEWKRSDSSRMWSLRASNDDLPTSLILVYHGSEVVGHCKLRRLPCLNNACFVESVVISSNHRGKGWGKFLMLKTEEYALSRGLVSVYLSTQGQEEFYRKLGYSECPAVNIYGAPPLTPVPANRATEMTLNSPPPPPLPPPDMRPTFITKPTKTFMQKQLALLSIS